MVDHWSVTGPRVLDIGDEGDRVRRLTVTVVGGSVDVVTHGDTGTARIEVSELQGPELSVRWDGDTVTITHGTTVDLGSLESLKKLVGIFDDARVRLSISVPDDTECTVTTVTASALVAGLRAPVRVRTASGSMTVDDTVGTVDVKTVNGDVDCHALHGVLRVSGVAGSVTAHQCKLSEISSKSVSGDLALDLVDGHSSITASTVSGALTVRAPHNGVDVSGSSMSGRVVVDGEEVGRSGSKGRFRSGDGSLRIRATSVSGDVVVLPPVPPEQAEDAAHEQSPAV